MSKDFDTQKQDLMKEVRSVLNEVETLYETSVDNGSEQAKALKVKVQERLSRAKDRLQGLEGTVVEKAKETAARTDELVHEKPYHAMGIAALTGVVFGILIGHSCKR